jgi:hypothetical protein
MSVEEETRERARSLEAALDADMIREKGRATADYWVSVVLMIVTLAASFTAGIGALGFQWSARTTGIVAFIPGAVAIVMTTMKFEGKANWHYRKLYGLSSLRNRLKYELSIPIGVEQVAAISREHRELTSTMEREWETSLSLSWTQFKSHPASERRPSTSE